MVAPTDTTDYQIRKAGMKAVQMVIIAENTKRKQESMGRQILFRQQKGYNVDIAMVSRHRQQVFTRVSASHLIQKRSLGYLIFYYTI